MPILSNINIHSSADVQTVKVGNNTRVWQFAVVLKGAKIGENCNINCHTFIENDVVIGNRVTVKSGVYIWDGIQIDDDVFIGPNVTFTNDKYPRSKAAFTLARTYVGKGATIGAGTIILPGITLGAYAMTGAGSLITKDVPSHALYVGHPAKFVCWIDEQGQKLHKISAFEYENKQGHKYTLRDNEMSKI